MVDVCLVSPTLCVGGSVNRTNRSIVIYWFGTIADVLRCPVRAKERPRGGQASAWRAAYRASGRCGDVSAQCAWRERLPTTGPIPTSPRHQRLLPPAPSPAGTPPPP